MTKASALPCLVGLALLVLLVAPASATGIGSAGVGPVGTGAGLGAYVRQRVQLVRRGDVLVGEPQLSPVQLISIHTPGPVAQTAILRWASGPDHRLSLYLSTEKPLQISRATLFMRPTAEPLTLHEHREAGWFPVEGQSLAVAGTGGRRQHLMAFTVTGLGPYWLLKPGAIVSGKDTPALGSLDLLLNGNPVKAFGNWFWPAVLLVTVLLIARYRHRLELNART